MDFESETFIAHSLRGEGFDASEDGTGRGTPLVPVLPFDPTQITSVTNRSQPNAGDPCHSLANGARAPAIAFDCKSSGQNGFGIGIEVAGTQRAMGHANSHTNGGGHQAVAFQCSQSGVRIDDVHATLDSNNGPRRHNGALLGMQVRRLTPRECERLQGFPDNYTLVKHGQRIRPEKLEADWIKYLARGNPKGLTREEAAGLAADGPRYKALGNSWAVPCARWIGQRIQAVSAIARTAA